VTWTGLAANPTEDMIAVKIGSGGVIEISKINTTTNKVVPFEANELVSSIIINLSYLGWPRNLL
jgi:hypothetical protein